LGNIFNSFLVYFWQAHEGVLSYPQHKQSFSLLSCWFHARAVGGRLGGMQAAAAARVAREQGRGGESKKRCSPLQNDMVLVSMDTVAANKALIVRVVVALAVVGAA
jgi:hypothetical protein